MKKVSVILIDWNARESFHALDYLAEQTVPRSDYEIIWVEYYEHRPEALQRHWEQGNIDKWIVLGEEGMYFKHRMYNEGVLASTGDIIVVCDSDALFSPTFIESVAATFSRHENEDIVLYLEEIRNDNQNFYPFKKVSWETVMTTPVLVNWNYDLKRPTGLISAHDAIHQRNYGACFCATRKAVLEAGGFDEHESYHCFMCGPYELGWRLVNKGFREIWHQEEWLLHVWHPRPEANPGEIIGKHDGKGINLTALEILKNKRTGPLVENESVKKLRVDSHGGPDSLSSYPENVFSEYDRINTPDGRQNSWHKLQAAAAFWTSPYRLERLLLVTESIHQDRLARDLKSTGLIENIEVFAYDLIYHAAGAQGMNERLLLTGKYFLPELIIFVPLANREIYAQEEQIEPSFETISRIKELTGAKMVLCENGADDGASGWFSLADKVIPLYYPAYNPTLFYNWGLVRDIDVSFCGAVPLGSKREEYISYLRSNGIAVHTRLHRVSEEKYAEILNRSKISLNFAREIGTSANRRPLEAAACCSLVLNENDSFNNREELLHKVRYYLEHDREREKVIMGAHKARTCTVKALWEKVFVEMGFRRIKGGTWRKTEALLSGSGFGKKLLGLLELGKLSTLKKVAIYGASLSGQQCYEFLVARGIKPAFFLDNNRKDTFMGLPVYPVNYLSEQEAPAIDGIFLAFNGKKDWVRAQLKENNFHKRVIDFIELKQVLS